MKRASFIDAGIVIGVFTTLLIWIVYPVIGISIAFLFLLALTFGGDA